MRLDKGANGPKLPLPPNGINLGEARGLALLCPNDDDDDDDEDEDDDEEEEDKEEDLE